jgi:hypothetical protein
MTGESKSGHTILIIKTYKPMSPESFIKSHSNMQYTRTLEKFHVLSSQRSLIQHPSPPQLSTLQLCCSSDCCSSDFLLFYLFKAGSHRELRLAWNWLCSLGWPWMCDPPASASQMLGLQLCVTMPGFLIHSIWHQVWRWAMYPETSIK